MEVPHNIIAAQLREKIDVIIHELSDAADGCPDPLLDPAIASEWFGGMDLADDDGHKCAVNRLKEHKQEWGEDQHYRIIAGAMGLLHVLLEVRSKILALDEITD